MNMKKLRFIKERKEGRLAVAEDDGGRAGEEQFELCFKPNTLLAKPEEKGTIKRSCYSAINPYEFLGLIQIAYFNYQYLFVFFDLCYVT